MILFVKNIDIEGPETLGDFFSRRGFECQTVDLYVGESLKNVDINKLEAVVVFGGPMNVYEEDKYPFLKEEDDFIKKILVKNIPYLGICLGGQLLAKACEAKVGKSPMQEIGFSYVELTKEGQEDPLFEGISSSVFVYQWHGDMFEIPATGALLASSKDCPHQAFRVGKNAYGIQFHVEITDKSVHEWSDEYFDYTDENQRLKKEKMVSDYVNNKKLFHSTANQIYENFLEIIQSRISAQRLE